MKFKQHINRWVLLLAVSTLVCTAAGKFLFANADTQLFVKPLYESVTPTSSSYLEAYSWQSVTPTSAASYLVQSVTPTSSARTLVYNDWFEEPSVDVLPVVSVTPTSATVLSFQALEPVPEPVIQEQPIAVPVTSVTSVQYNDYLPVVLSVGNVVTDDTVLDGFIYTLEFLGSEDPATLAPDMPIDKSVVVAGTDTDSFEAVYFREPGQYYFKVSQDQVNNVLNVDKGYAWNDTWYFVSICVEEGATGFEPTTTYYEVTSGGNCIPRSSIATFTQVRSN